MADSTGRRGRWLVGAARNCEGCDDGRGKESLDCHGYLLTSSFPNGSLAGCGARGAAYVLLKVRAPGLLMV